MDGVVTWKIKPQPGSFSLRDTPLHRDIPITPGKTRNGLRCAREAQVGHPTGQRGNTLESAGLSPQIPSDVPEAAPSRCSQHGHGGRSSLEQFSMS